MILVDTATAAAARGVRPAVIRLWVYRGKLTPVAVVNGRHLYDLAAVAAVRDNRTVDNAA